MKRFLKNNKNIKPVDDKITDAMLGTGEHMCTCAALVADIIVEHGQEKESVGELLKKVQAEERQSVSATEQKP
ncbi:MAG TPA: hypothetical protein VN642_19095 [Dongiaceae bacterium]|nr:hypothetical protein [Dongiaceae bacterium]